jgi:AraC-like DNA-binding protein
MRNAAQIEGTLQGETRKTSTSHSDRGITLRSMSGGYREHEPPRNLRALVACLWENEADRDRVQLVIPDGCVDLIWIAPHGLVVAGADTGPRHVEMTAGTRLSGIRLKPGAAGAVLGVPAVEVRNSDTALSSIWGDDGARLETAVGQSKPVRRLELLAAAVAGRNAEPDLLTVAAADMLAAPSARVSTVAAELGVSERHLHRRVLAAVGYGPKMLARVARLRRLVDLSEPRLATRAAAAGYASQSHMNEEVRRLTGSTPVRFLKDAGRSAA